MHHRLAVALVAALVLAMSMTCWAQGFTYGAWQAPAAEQEPTASWFGFTGLVRTPSAVISPPQQLTGSVHEIKFGANDRRVYAVTVGVMPTLEVGAARMTNVPQINAETTYISETVVNLKYETNLGGLFNNPVAPTMAIGTFDIADKMNRVNYIVISQPTGLATESVSPLSNMNVNVGYGKAERNGGALDGLFGGIDFVPYPHALVQIEHDGKDVNSVLRYFPVPWLSLDVGKVSSETGWGVSVTSLF